MGRDEAVKIPNMKSSLTSRTVLVLNIISKWDTGADTGSGARVGLVERVEEEYKTRFSCATDIDNYLVIMDHEVNKIFFVIHDHEGLSPSLNSWEHT